MQETWVQSLVQEDHTCCRATGPVSHSYWSPRDQESLARWNHSLFVTLSCIFPNKRSHFSEKPMHHNPCLLQLQKSPNSTKDPAQPKINKLKKKKNTQHSKNKIIAFGPITYWQMYGGEWKQWLQMVNAAMKLKDTYSLEEKLWHI